MVEPGRTIIKVNMLRFTSNGTGNYEKDFTFDVRGCIRSFSVLYMVLLICSVFFVFSRRGYIVVLSEFVLKNKNKTNLESFIWNVERLLWVQFKD